MVVSHDCTLYVFQTRRSSAMRSNAAIGEVLFACLNCFSLRSSGSASGSHFMHPATEDLLWPSVYLHPTHMFKPCSMIIFHSMYYSFFYTGTVSDFFICNSILPTHTHNPSLAVHFKRIQRLSFSRSSIQSRI